MYSELTASITGLIAYIEATYHASHPTLVAVRRALLDAPGMIAQAPYVESAARYACPVPRNSPTPIPRPATGRTGGTSSAGVSHVPARSS